MAEPDRGPGDHSKHVHISVVDDPTLYDDKRPWPFNLSHVVPGKVAASPPKLKLGDSGPAVVDLQNLLGIKADGVFGPQTEQAVRDFQGSRNLLVDGIVGSHTWGALTASALPKLPAPAFALSPAAIEQITKLAGDSDLARVSWTDRGTAPRGYIKGMAVTFGQVYAKWKAGDSAARLMAAMNSGNDAADALSWYESRFRAASMDNSASGAATLRHLFVLLIGLGMRESSGKYNEGRDMSASNTDAETAEAGLFQMSWNARAASPELPKLFTAYSAKPEGFLSTFQEGVPAKDTENVGAGEGVAFQRLCKSCPAFAVETAAVGLRVLRKHWGPITRHEAEIRPEADKLLQQVQSVVDAQVVVVPDPGPVPSFPFPPPVVANPQQLLMLILMMLLKEKPMADDPARPGQGVDLTRLLLPLLLQSILSGKQINTTELLSALLTGKPIASPALAPTPTPTPAPQPTPQLPNDLATLLLPLLYQRLTGKPWPDASSSVPMKPADAPTSPTAPIISKPSVQLSVAGLGVSTILQALGIVGTPFGMGQAPTLTGTLATLIPIATAALGATGGFGSLLSIGRTLFKGFANAFGQPK